VTPGAIGRRYGRALFDLAVEAGLVDEIGAGLAEIASALEDNAQASGSLSAIQRQQLAQSFLSRLGSDSLMGRFLGVLAENDRLAQLPSIRDNYEKIGDAAAGRVRAHIRSAQPLSDAERSALRGKLEAVTGHKVVDTAEVDPGLIGGATVEADGRIYDGSVRTQLARLERRMAG
jgi:F-type H+-transporting ATPase subunit delta